MPKHTKTIKELIVTYKQKYSHLYGYTLITIVAVVVGCLGGISFEKHKYKSFLQGFQVLRENSDKYTYINPLIGNLTSPATDVGIYTDIQSEIVSYLDKEKKDGELYDYSFYFRDLTSGLWFGANESSSFFPASLFKLPIAIAVYKQGENDHSFLTRYITYTEEISKKNTLMQLNAESTLTVGQSYTVEDLVERMLISSDNGAKDLLLSVVDPKYLESLFDIVSLVDPKSTKKYEISSRKYALFLRVLYGSSYLDEPHSEFILNMLAKSDFKDGLVAGVPGNVVISHKFGTYQFDETINGQDVVTNQLHDCGIVYHSSRPYLVCFMTKGKSLDVLYKVISHVSNLVYTYQDTVEE